MKIFWALLITGAIIGLYLLLSLGFILLGVSIPWNMCLAFIVEFITGVFLLTKLKHEE